VLKPASGTVAAAAAGAALTELEALATEFGREAATRKRTLLEALQASTLDTAAEVVRFHDLLVFLRAWPDDPGILALTERCLDGFENRRDLRRLRRELADSGIAGTEIRFRFFQPSASWLARRWPARLAIDWRQFGSLARLNALLPLLGTYSESPGLESYAFPPRKWIDLMKGPDETDAGFLVRRIDALKMDPLLREQLFDDLDPPFRLVLGGDAPSRTREKLPRRRIAYRTGPLSRRRALDTVPVRMRALPLAAARRLIDLARGGMAVRHRDLEAFAHAEAADVRIADCGDGVEVALLGVVPERRFLIETLYGFLLLKNGVFVGYGTGIGLYCSCEIAFNLFPAFRKGAAAALYTCVLAVFRRLFGADTFHVDPYQIGQDNQEALASGAWWFYAKLGFEPRDEEALHLAQAERRRVRAGHGHRTPLATLKRLARDPLFLHLGRKRDDVSGLLDLSGAGLAVTRYLARRFGSRRESGLRTCEKEAAELLGLHDTGHLAKGERLALRRWAPLLLAMQEVAHWTPAERKRVLKIVRAKGGRRESDYTVLFDRHRRLREALRKLAGSALV